MKFVSRTKNKKKKKKTKSLGESNVNIALLSFDIFDNVTAHKLARFHRRGEKEKKVIDKN